jgi:hypothetical protein
MAQDEEDNANFLDNDEIAGVSDNLYDWTLDQVMVLGLPSLPVEERKPINWNCPEPLYSTKAIRHIGRQYEVSFSIVVQNALAHGFPMFQHKHQNVVSLIGNLDDAAVTSDSENYVNHLVYKPILGRDIRRLVTVTDIETAEQMGNTAAILGTSRSHLAGVCILMSLITGDLVPEVTKQRFQKHVSAFETGLKMYEIMATNLI